MENERDNDFDPAQWLHLLNSSHIQRKLEQGTRLQEIFNARRPQQETIEVLYLTILSRFPTAAEVENARAYCAPAAEGKSAKANSQARREGLVDIAWSLINSTEFLFRH